MEGIDIETEAREVLEAYDAGQLSWAVSERTANGLAQFWIDNWYHYDREETSGDHDNLRLQLQSELVRLGLPTGD